MVSQVKARVEEIQPVGPRIREETLEHVDGLKKKRFLKALSERGVTRDGCQAAGVTRQAVHLWKQRDPGFEQLFGHALEDAADNLEIHALKRATAEKKPSDLLCIFMLKAMRPLKYRDNVSISGHDGGPLFRMVAGVSPATVCGIESKPKPDLASKPKALLETDKAESKADVKS